MLCHDRLQGGHRVLDGPHRQHKFGTLFPRRHPQLIQPDGFWLSEWPVGKFGKCGAAPQGQCLIENLGGLLAARLGRCGEGVFEPGGVELERLDAE